MFYTKVKELAEHLGLSGEEIERLEKVAEQFPMRIPDYYLGLIDPSDPADPIRKMSVPSLYEEDEDGSFDTSGEQYNTKIPGLQHKYRQTAMILSTNRCAMYCRHCFRKRLVGLSEEEIARHFDEIMDYIRSHEEINNVLISGGDAFMNNDGTIARYLAELTAIDHLDYIRFGSRTVVSWPERINDGLLNILREYSRKKQIYVVTQFNHPRELSPQAVEAVRSLQKAGCVLRNQTVLMRGVNDNVSVLSELLQGLTAVGCAPYYIFQCRPVRGVKNYFQLPMEEGLRIVEAAKARQSGMGKGVKYCMSHPAGKLEIVGHAAGHGILFKFHEAKDEKNCGRMFLRDVTPDACWLPEDLELDI